jgi:hypothetical protein
VVLSRREKYTARRFKEQSALNRDLWETDF